MNILIEGPDGSGKSTLISQLQDALTLEGYSVGIHAPNYGPPKDHEKTKEGFYPRIAQHYAAIQDHLNNFKSSGEPDFMIFDRSPIISEFCYGGAFRPELDLIAFPDVVAHMFSSVPGVTGTATVFVLPGWNTYVQQYNDREKQSKSWKSEEHLKNVHTNLGTIYKRYQYLLDLGHDNRIDYLYRYSRFTDNAFPDMMESILMTYKQLVGEN